jgi:hypothetical protein
MHCAWAVAAASGLALLLRFAYERAANVTGEASFRWGHSWGLLFAAGTLLAPMWLIALCIRLAVLRRAPSVLETGEFLTLVVFAILLFMG